MLGDDTFQPRILLITPEISLVPERSCKNSDYLNFKPGGFAGFLSDWAGELHARGVDVHIVQPDYRSAFVSILRNNPRTKECRMPTGNVHLTEDRAFFYAGHPEANGVRQNIKISLAFQREVIHQILPAVRPDLIHCHDWMCGLIPAVARKSGIPCIFSLHNCETAKCFLSDVEDSGIDAAFFWQQLFFDHFPGKYEEIRETNAIDFLLSGVFAARHVSIASPAVLLKIAESFVHFPEAPLGKVLAEKLAVDCNAATEVQQAGMQFMNLYERLLGRPLLKIGAKSKFRSESRQPPIPFDLKGLRPLSSPKYLAKKKGVMTVDGKKGKFAGERLRNRAFVYPADKENLEARA
jgi:starch synthase/alpha-amylase